MCVAYILVSLRNSDFVTQKLVNCVIEDFCEDDQDIEKNQNQTEGQKRCWQDFLRSSCVLYMQFSNLTNRSNHAHNRHR
jgi:hypothetical protein